MYRENHLLFVSLVFIAGALLVQLGCENGSSPDQDSGVEDSGNEDSGNEDSGNEDSGNEDGGAQDSGGDTGGDDGSLADSQPADSGDDAQADADQEPLPDGVIIVDHRSLNTADIPTEWLDAVKRDIRWHFTHTSHGDQLIEGLREYEAAHGEFAVSIAQGSLPGGETSLSLYDDRTHYRDYWDHIGPDRVFGILDANPTINVTGFCWCRDLNDSWFTGELLDQYVEQLQEFESHYVDQGRSMRAIYFTGTADVGGDEGVIRYQNNEQIRQWVLDHPEENPILFDFADIECWAYDDEGVASDYRTYTQDGTVIPLMHPDYEYEEGTGHTNELNRELKARAVWWMLARIAGWSGE